MSSKASMMPSTCHSPQPTCPRSLSQARFPSPTSGSPVGSGHTSLPKNMSTCHYLHHAPPPAHVPTPRLPGQLSRPLRHLLTQQWLPVLGPPCAWAAALNQTSVSAPQPLPGNALLLFETLWKNKICCSFKLTSLKSKCCKDYDTRGQGTPGDLINCSFS